MKSYILLTVFALAVHEGKPQRNEGDRCVDANTGTVGVCLPPDRCDSAVRDLMYNGINPTFCMQSFYNSLVCCRDGSNILNAAPFDSSWDTSAGNTQLPRQGRVSARKCVEYSRGVTETVSFVALLPEPEPMTVSAAKCNYARVELIVGGEDAELGEFPHMAAIGWPTVQGGYAFKCGGALISERFVLTAAHCLYSPRDSSLASPTPTVVRLGDHNIDNDVNDGASPVEVPIKELHKHPDYHSPVRYNDIALLELATAVDFQSSVRPACLWAQPGFGGHTKTVATGWGVTDTRTHRSSNLLQKVSLELFENSFCDPLLRRYRNRHWLHGFNETQLCAGDLRGGKDTCQGDSGGPLQIALKENHCVFYIMGVTSFGGRCAEPGEPAVYTRVSSYLDWIESVVWPNGD